MRFYPLQFGLIRWDLHSISNIVIYHSSSDSNIRETQNDIIKNRQPHRNDKISCESRKGFVVCQTTWRLFCIRKLNKKRNPNKLLECQLNYVERGKSSASNQAIQTDASKAQFVSHWKPSNREINIRNRFNASYRIIVASASASHQHRIVAFSGWNSLTKGRHSTFRIRIYFLFFLFFAPKIEFRYPQHVYLGVFVCVWNVFCEIFVVSCLPSHHPNICLTRISIACYFMIRQRFRNWIECLFKSDNIFIDDDDDAISILRMLNIMRFARLKPFKLCKFWVKHFAENVHLHFIDFMGWLTGRG